MSSPLVPSGCALVYPGREPFHAVRNQLRDWRIRLLEPADREEALTLLPELRPDLHLIEDGGVPANEAALRAIGRSLLAGQVPVMVLAGDDMGPREARKLLALGATDVVFPPHDLALVAAKAEALIRLKRRIDHARELSVRDELTGLYNRRFFFERLDQEVARSRRTGQSLALVLFDVDYFKKVNDTYGHPVGDAVLRSISGALARHTRKGDLAARVGGDEFAMLLGASGLSGAQACALGLRSRVGELVIGQHELRVTISLGVAAYPHPLVLDPVPDLVRLADEALFRAKAAGRDRVQLAG